jgi:hypothetical protein
MKLVYLVLGVIIGAVGWVYLGSPAMKSVRAAKPAPCVGCSVDGKTTPRTPDGHPDLNGHWGGGGGGGPEDGPNIVQKSDDGSVLFDFAGNDLDENGNPTSAVKATAPTPGHVSFNIGSDKPEDNAPYKPEYLAKAKEIGDQTYGAANGLDPNQACKPGGIPRAAFGDMEKV